MDLGTVTSQNAGGTQSLDSTWIRYRTKHPQGVGNRVLFVVIRGEQLFLRDNCALFSAVPRQSSMVT
jgi:hypothetical protein